MIRNYAAGDREAAGALWADNAPRQGYAPRSRAEVDGMLFGHPYFSPEHAFVLEEGGALRALICGCTGDDIPRGDERGYFTCLIADAAHDTDETAQTLFGALEASFRAKGKTYGAVTFFNPMRLPWVIPGTPGYEHNNMPGIAADLPLHGRMLRRGYRETSRECAMFRDLSDFTVPDSAGAFAAKLAKQGFAIGRYDSERHTGLHEMLVSFENPDWMKQVTEAAEKRMLLPVALAGSRVAGEARPAAISRASASCRSTSTAAWAACCSTACAKRKSRSARSICRCSRVKTTRRKRSMRARAFAPRAFSASC